MNTLNLIERSSCAISGNRDLEPLHEVNDFPVFMGCVHSTALQDVVADMRWSISRSSGLIQLSSLIPLDVLYPESHGSGGAGRLWDMHHKAFAKYLNKTAPKSVLEIGGAHGKLSMEYTQYKHIPWTILEPNPSPVDGCHARFINGFFDENFKYSDEFDTIVHSHVFEHIYKPDEFMRHLSGLMTAGRKLVFSLPNMQVMLERKYTNCLNFEHTVFLTEPYVEHLLSKYGFRLLDKQYFKEDHSIFYAYVKDASVELTPLPEGMYERNKALYLNYVQYHEDLIADLNSKIVTELGDRPLYLFGAHVFAQHLIQFGLRTEQIVSILDNDPNKQRKRLYGTKLMVASPKILSRVDSPVVILKAGVYNQEIMTDILENINSSTTFWE